MDYFCVICSVSLPDSRRRFAVSGRTEPKLIDVIENLPFCVEAHASSHVCRQCKHRLLKKVGLERSYEACLKEIRDAHDSRESSRKEFPAISRHRSLTDIDDLFHSLEASTPVPSCHQDAATAGNTSFSTPQKRASNAKVTVSYLYVDK